MGANQGWIVVTGATAGIGKMLLERLARDGRKTIAAVRDPARVATAAGRAEAVRLDFEDDESLAEAVREIERIAGGEGVAGLVNMAGIIVEGPIEATPPQDLRRQFEINVIGPYALARALLPALRRGRGAIVNVGAVSAYLTPPFYGPIAASKAALASLSDAMRQEFAPLGVRVGLIHPGAMRTGIFATARQAREARLAAAPELAARYRPAIEAMEKAFARSGADDPRVVVDAAVAALAGRGPAVRVVGRGAGAFVLLSRLPTGLRDRLVRNALGLSKALKPA